MYKTAFFLASLLLLLAIAPIANAANLWDVYQLALRNDPTYQKAEATYLATKEDKPIATAAYLPNLNLTGGITHTNGTSSSPQFFASQGVVTVNSTSNTTTKNYSLQLNQPLFRWDRWEAINQADANVAQAKAQYEAAQQDLIVRTATAYFNVLSARDQLAATEATKAALSKQLEEAKKKFEVGLSAITDVQEAQAAYDQAVADEIGARQKVSTSEEALRAITGRQFEKLEEPPANMPLKHPEPADPKAWVTRALGQNLDLTAARFAAKAADSNVQVKEAGHYPSLDLVLSRNYNNSTGSSDFSVPGVGGVTSPADRVGTNNSIGLQLTVPLYSGGGVSAEVRQAKHQYNAAEDQVTLVARQTEQNTRDAYLGVLTGISRVQALRQSVKSNQTALKATEAGLQVGTRTTVDVLNSRQNLLKAVTDLAKSRYDYLVNVLKLKQSAGMLTPTDLQQINNLLRNSKPAIKVMPNGPRK